MIYLNSQFKANIQFISKDLNDLLRVQSFRDVSTIVIQYYLVASGQLARSKYLMNCYLRENPPT